MYIPTQMVLFFTKASLGTVPVAPLLHQIYTTLLSINYNDGNHQQ